MVVGCGSGVYTKHACERNLNIRILGLELQKKVADLARENTIKWQIDDRVTIVHIDIRDYKDEKPTDIITFYNLIYYFPVIELIELLRHLGGLFNKCGRLILTTLCPVNDPSIQLMNLWASMTNGCGALPHPEHVCDQLKEAGFDAIYSEKLIPGFNLLTSGEIS